MSDLLGVLSEEWAIRALIASSLVGVMCGVIGSYMVLRNMSLIGDAISHAILPGIFIAFILIGYSSIGFFVGTLFAALFSALAMTWIQDNVKTKNDAAIGIVFTFMFSIGVIGISYLNNQQGVHLDLKDFLFGTILGVSNEDIIITSMVTLFSLISIVVFYRYLFISTFQPTIASTMGISVKGMHYFLMLLLSFAIVASLRTVGIILVVAMLITPSATALLLSDKLKHVLVISGIIGLASAVIGLFLAIVFNTTPGPAMCVIVTVFYLTAVLFSPKKGIIFRMIRKSKLESQIQQEDILKSLFKSKGIQMSRLDDLANKINLSRQKINSHFKKLVEIGKIVVHGEKYVLTVGGKNTAKDLVRAHRLWETFLVDQVGLSNDEIHEDAEKYEHLLNTEILDQLDAKLGFPTTDPHGSPIPTKILKAKNPLSGLSKFQKGKISKIQINDQIESQLWELGLSPEAIVQIDEVRPDEIVITSGKIKVTIPGELAIQINLI